MKVEKAVSGGGPVRLVGLDLIQTRLPLASKALGARRAAIENTNSGDGAEGRQHRLDVKITLHA